MENKYKLNLAGAVGGFYVLCPITHAHVCSCFYAKHEIKLPISSRMVTVDKRGNYCNHHKLGTVSDVRGNVKCNVTLNKLKKRAN